MSKNKFHIRLKELRLEKGLTQKQLAEALHVGRATVGDWEARNLETSFDMLIELANYFDVTTDYLLGIENYEEI